MVEHERAAAQVGRAAAAPAIAGAAAWMAGRDRRRSVSDPLATTPLPAARRHLTLVSATTAWALFGYLLVATYMFVRTAPNATWSGPEIRPVVVVAAVMAHAAWAIWPATAFFRDLPLINDD
ncbi:MAG: hypothetical protein M9890_11230 [Thermomicrobiales bacterium]|nr:hypothetical protein [Thermomicrobiales bacterium]